MSEPFTISITTDEDYVLPLDTLARQYITRAIAELVEAIPGLERETAAMALVAAAEEEMEREVSDG